MEMGQEWEDGSDEGVGFGSRWELPELRSLDCSYVACRVMRSKQKQKQLNIITVETNNEITTAKYTKCTAMQEMTCYSLSRSAVGMPSF